MTSFTPGPWVMASICSCADGGDCERPSPGVDVIARVAHPDAMNKAVVRVDDALGLPFEANARLIAAAPDLYEALEQAVLYLESLNSFGRNPRHAMDGLSMSGSIQDGRAALAKADGTPSSAK